MKIDTSSVKKGVILQVEGKLFKVIDISHTHTGRWSATYTFKAKDIINGWNQNLTYKSGTILEQVEVQTKNAIYLYSWWDTYSFMEQDNSEIYDIPKDQIEDIIPYLKENLDCFIMIFEGNVIGVILPNVIEYTIAETVPGVKWDRATAGKKPATLDNGLETMVALHLEAGSTVRINTVTGDIA
jgi:elongation factor P